MRKYTVIEQTHLFAVDCTLIYNSYWFEINLFHLFIATTQHCNVAFSVNVYIKWQLFLTGAILR